MATGNPNPNKITKKVESKKDTLKKETLKQKEGHYWEFKPLFDSLPEDLPVPENPIEIKNNRTMFEKEMVKDHKPFSKEEAFGLACKHKKENREGLIWFKDGDELSYLELDGRSEHVSVSSFHPGLDWKKGTVSFFSKK